MEILYPGCDPCAYKRVDRCIRAAIVKRMDLAVIENEALKLSAAERALLADHLMASLAVGDTPVMKAWAEEGERRLSMFREGKISAVDGRSAVSALRKKS